MKWIILELICCRRDDKHAKKLEEYKAYNPAKELRASILMAVIPALASAFYCILTDNGRLWQLWEQLLYV